MQRLFTIPWENLLARYEFMIVFSTFRRNVAFYSSMDRGQLRNLYSQLVSFSPARILTIDTLVSTYEKGAPIECQQGGSPLHVPHELSRVVTLIIGNSVPELFVRECIASCQWKGYEYMVLSAFAAAETVRGGALKYMAIVKESRRRRGPLRAIISLAITGWMVNLSDSECMCGTWAQALNLVSYFVPDAETTLTVQDEARTSAYICTLLDISPPPNEETGLDADEPVDYGNVFSELLVWGLDKRESEKELNRKEGTHHQLAADQLHGAAHSCTRPGASSEGGIEAQEGSDH